MRWEERDSGVYDPEMIREEFRQHFFRRGSGMANESDAGMSAEDCAARFCSITELARLTARTRWLARMLEKYGDHLPECLFEHMDHCACGYMRVRAMTKHETLPRV